MRDHQSIDKRSLEMALAIVRKIDADPEKKGINKALSICNRWYEMHGTACIKEWLSILENMKWEEIRTVLLDPSDEGKRLRQNSPFCGILNPLERWEIYRKFKAYDQGTA